MERGIIMTKTAYAFLATGFEEVEALAVVDILHRCNINIKTVSITGEKLVTSSHGIGIMADLLFDDIKDTEADLLFLPGGMPGTLNLGAHDGLHQMLIKHFEAGRHVAAVCAAPSVLGTLGFLKGRKATCYPGFEDKLEGAVVLTDDRSVRFITDGNVTTSRGMGTSVELGIELARILTDDKTAHELALATQTI